jgi:hypothetical protein
LLFTVPGVVSPPDAIGGAVPWSYIVVAGLVEVVETQSAGSVGDAL